MLTTKLCFPSQQRELKQLEAAIATGDSQLYSSGAQNRVTLHYVSPQLEAKFAAAYAALLSRWVRPMSLSECRAFTGVCCMVVHHLLPSTFAGQHCGDACCQVSYGADAWASHCVVLLSTCACAVTCTA